MKKLTFMFAILSIVFLSCIRQGDLNPNNSNTPNNSGNSNNPQTVVSGNWRVALFSDSGNDETSDFAGYTFNFGSAGVVTVTRNGNTVTGTWSLNSGSRKFHINLGPKIDSNPLGELTDDWEIIEVSNTQIRLTDDNPASAEFLTFAKI